MFSLLFWSSFPVLDRCRCCQACKEDFVSDGRVITYCVTPVTKAYNGAQDCWNFLARKRTMAYENEEAPNDPFFPLVGVHHIIRNCGPI